MTNSARAGARVSALTLGLVGLALGAGAAQAAYPFEGTWVRANRTCTANAPLARTYTAREVTSPRVHCTIGRIATGSGQFELFETCGRGDRQGNVTETIRMQGADAMVVRRQVVRLKIARPLRYARCSVAAPAPAPPKAAPGRHSSPTGTTDRDADDPAPKPPAAAKP